MACFTGKKSLEGVCVYVCGLGGGFTARVERQHRQWRDEEGGIEDAGIRGELSCGDGCHAGKVEHLAFL